MRTVLWDAEPETYPGCDAAPEESARCVADHVQSGSVILLRAMYNPDAVLAAPDILVPQFREEGCVFCTVPEPVD